MVILLAYRHPNEDHADELPLGDSKAALAREFGISWDTLYRYVPVKKRRAGRLQNELYAGNGGKR